MSAAVEAGHVAKAVLSDLPVEGGATNAEATGDLAHMTFIALDRQTDEVPFYGVEGPDMPLFVKDPDRRVR